VAVRCKDKARKRSGDSLFPAKYSRAREDIPSFATSHAEYAVNYKFRFLHTKAVTLPPKMGLGPNRTVTLLSAQPMNGLAVQFSGTAWGHVHISEKQRLATDPVSSSNDSRYGKASSSGHGRDGEAQDLRGEGARRRGLLPHRRIRYAPSLLPPLHSNPS
jgi:hypothetical protein